MSKSDYVAADEPKLDEIIRQAESRLAAQLALGIAADQRAMTLTGVLSALAAAIVALGATKGMSTAVCVMTGSLLIAALFALIAAQPVAWAVVGTSPADWIEDIAHGQDDLRSAKAAMADHYAGMIAQNDRVLASNGDMLRAALVVALFTPIFATIALAYSHG